VVERVKDKIAHAPFARDFDKIMTIMEEATGEKNFSAMNEAQLLQLDEALDRELAATV
jgi:hypothetical protein